MDRKNLYTVFVIAVLVIFFMLFFFRSCFPRTCATKTITVSTRIPSSTPFGKTSLTSAKKEVALAAPSAEGLRIKINEKIFEGGNQGYIVRDGQYVYFGFRTIIREEGAE